MPENDHVRRIITDLAEAFGLLSRLPVKSNGARGAQAAWAWPIVGATLGLFAGLLGGAMVWVGLPVGLAAASTIACQIILIGALHEDGLADCADGFWGGNTQQRRLDIMKDSAIGSYGTIALILLILARFSIISALFSAGYFITPLVVAAGLSRGAMVLVMGLLPPSRPSGLAAKTGRPDRETMGQTAIVALLIAILFAGFHALPALLGAALGGWVVARVALGKIGGQTGDVLGASQQLAELGALICLAIMLG